MVKTATLKTWMMVMSRIEEVQDGRESLLSPGRSPVAGPEVNFRVHGLTAEREVDLQVSGKVTISVTGFLVLHICGTGHHKVPDNSFFDGSPKCMNSSFLSALLLPDPGENLGGHKP